MKDFRHVVEQHRKDHLKRLSEPNWVTPEMMQPPMLGVIGGFGVTSMGLICSSSGNADLAGSRWQALDNSTTVQGETTGCVQVRVQADGFDEVTEVPISSKDEIVKVMSDVDRMQFYAQPYARAQARDQSGGQP